MNFDGREIANFTLDVCDLRSRSITHLSLQKILFFCHVFSLLELKRPLIKSNFEAWEHGPVLQHVYREFRECGNKPIKRRATKLNYMTGARDVVNYDLDRETECFLTKIIDIYSRLSASELVNLAHIKDGPWYKVWNHPNRINPGMVIDNLTIINFYSGETTSERHYI